MGATGLRLWLDLARGLTRASNFVGLLGGMLFAAMGCSGSEETGTSGPMMTPQSPDEATVKPGPVEGVLPTGTGGAMPQPPGSSSADVPGSPSADVPSSPSGGVPAALTGTPEVLLDGLTFPCGLRDGGDALFVCDRRRLIGDVGDKVWRVAKTGGDATAVLELPQVDGVLMAADYFWVSAARESDGDVWAYNPSSWTVEEEFESSGPYFGLVANSTTMFAESGTSIQQFEVGPSSASSHPFWRATTQVLGVWHFVATDESVFATTNASEISNFGRDEPHPYRVVRIDIEKDSLDAHVELASGQGFAAGIALTATDVLFTDIDNDELNAVPRLGDSVRLLASVPSPRTIAVDASYAYVASRPLTCDGGGEIYRVPLAGGPVEVVASGQSCPSALVLDADALYWLNAGPSPVGPGYEEGTASILRLAL